MSAFIESARPMAYRCLIDDRDIIKSFESGWGKRLLMVGLAVAVVVLIVFVAWGFRGRHIAQNAAALTPVSIPTNPDAPSSR